MVGSSFHIFRALHPPGKATQGVHTCPTCFKTFTRSEHCTRHQLSHNKQRPFTCQFCGKTYARKDLVKRHERTIHVDEYSRQMEDENTTQSTSKNVDDNQEQEQEQTSPRPENAQSSSDSDSITVQVVPMVSPNPRKRPRHDEGEKANISATDPPTTRLPGGSISTKTTTVADDTPNVVLLEEISSANHGLGLDALDNGTGCSPGSDPLMFMQSLDFLGDDFDDMAGEFHFESGSGMPHNDASFPWRHATFAPLELQNHMPEQQQQQGFRSSDESLLTPESSRGPDHPIHSARENHPGRLPKILKETPASLPRILIDDDAYQHLQLDTCSRLGQSHIPLPLKNPWEVQLMLNGYIDSFHRHLPILHLASMKPSQTPSPLIWAMCCIGSLYRLDREKARRFHALADYRLRRDYLRRSQPPRRHTWEEWIERESMKRLLCGMFMKSNLLLILYDVVPGFDTSQDLDIEALEEERLWNAPTAAAWEVMRQAVIPCTKSIRDILADMLSEVPPDEDEVADSYGVSGFTALVAVHAVNIHNWHLSQVSRTMRRGMKTAGIAPNAMLQHSLAALTRCREVLRLSRPNGAEPMWDDPEGPLLFNCEAMLRAAYARLFTDASLPQRFTILCASSEDRQTALRDFVAAKQERSALMTKAVGHVLESILIPIKVGYLLVQKTAAFSWSVETAVSAWACVFLLCKWVYCIETLKPQDGPKELESRLISQVKTALHNMGCEYEEGRSLAAALGRAWASFHNDVWVWGITARLGQNLMELAELFESSYEEHCRNATTGSNEECENFAPLILERKGLTVWMDGGGNAE
ncbi:hypothetical protein BGZ61DRAFT_547744 [Ilyonectria robusta]|uniref:uncharacterized protein n=1 Tax=Ilyonectria robusta TaxID=1079257 RepID=UPI001E8DF214|nr:uncharacterized protein BGZ61DRAFT_547744 [Ilyonectria robusta]KAH8648245.1 hypothetical protein BGZ61DRAFT_547744 [Ilyonectria robusta]